MTESLSLLLHCAWKKRVFQEALGDGVALLEGSRKRRLQPKPKIFQKNPDYYLRHFLYTARTEQRPKLGLEKMCDILIFEPLVVGAVYLPYTNTT